MGSAVWASWGWISGRKDRPRMRYEGDDYCHHCDGTNHDSQPSPASRRARSLWLRLPVPPIGLSFSENRKAPYPSMYAGQSGRRSSRSRPCIAVCALAEGSNGRWAADTEILMLSVR